MRRKLLLAGLAAVVAGALALPAGASASSSVSPSSLVFNSNQVVGTTSTPQTATVTVSCSIVVIGCAIPGYFVPIPEGVPIITGDFAQTNTCGEVVISPGSCVFSVTFTPTTTGVRTGTLAPGIDLTGSSPSSVSLTGSGVAAPAPPTITPTPTGQRAAAIKKCKKKFPKGPKRKKCIKKAKKLPV